MSKITLNPVTNGQNISNINSNFAAIAEALNDAVLYRANPTGEPNQMENSLDMNGFDILNAGSIHAAAFNVNGLDIVGLAQTVADDTAQVAADKVSIDATAATVTGLVSTAQTVVASANNASLNALNASAAATTAATSAAASAAAAQASADHAAATYAPLDSPQFIGVPVVPTAAAGTSTTQAASTAFVANAVAAATAGVASFNGRTGNVLLSASDVNTALGYTAANTTAIPTKTSSLTNDSGFLTSVPVTSVAGRTGAITLAVADVTGAAPKASPALTGTVTINGNTPWDSGNFTPSLYQPVAGVTDASNASIGRIGEYKEVVIPSASAVSLTASTTANVAVLSLTAGDWEIFGAVNFNLTGVTTALYLSGGLSDTSATLLEAKQFSMQPPTSPYGFQGAACPVIRVNKSTGTFNVFLVAISYFNSGTVAAFGYIGARRIH